MGSEPQYPKGVFAWTGSCFCLSVCTLLCITQPFSLLLKVGESWDVKNVMIQSSVTHSQLSFSLQQNWKEKLESGVKAAFSETGPLALLYETDCLSGRCCTIIPLLMSACWPVFLCMYFCMCKCVRVCVSRSEVTVLPRDNNRRPK